jgi:glycosyltransferase involved in cell wall biosynthesis
LNLRILIAHWHGSIIGGTEKYIRALIPALERNGHSVALLHGYRNGENSDVPISRLVDRPVWFVEESTFEKTMDEIAAWGPNVVYVHTWESPYTERELLARYTCVIYVHDYHRSCPTGRKCHSFPDMRPCSLRSGPACLGLHYPRRCGGLNPLTMIRDYRRQSKQALNLRGYQAILVASRHMQQELAGTVDIERIYLTPLFPPDLNPDEAPPARRAIAGKLLMCGRLVSLKGAHVLINAVRAASSKLPKPLHLTIAGTGPDEAHLRQLANANGLEVEFAGWLNQVALTELMRHSDLLAFPSTWPEPFGLCGIEAGCVGLPAVGFEVGGVGDWLKPGYSGELASGNPPTSEGLADAMVRALQDDDHHAALRRGAWEMSRQFTLTRHTARLETILGRVCGRVDADPAQVGLGRTQAPQ